MIDDKTLKEIRKYAKDEKVPIMDDNSMKFLIKYIKQNKIKNILEIGTAIGYSAIMMSLIDKNIRVTTIERDEKRYLEAIKNIKKMKLEDRITSVYNDALKVNIEDKFDLIFIDAAKAQNEKFFLKFQNNLNSGGIIITDNMNFHGLVNLDSKDIESRNLRQLVRKIKDYKKFLEENNSFNTEFLDLGDGVAISVKKV